MSSSFIYGDLPQLARMTMIHIAASKWGTLLTHPSRLSCKVTEPISAEMAHPLSDRISTIVELDATKITLHRDFSAGI
jgi:hypothetical protein